MLIDLRRLFHWGFYKGSNPKESFDPRQDLSDIGADVAYKTFPGVGSLSKHRWTPLYAPPCYVPPLET